MPEMDGLELIKYVKNDQPHVCAIAMTGYSKDYQYMDVVNAGASDFINKPFLIEELEAKIKRAITERNIKQELNMLSITDSLTGLFNQRHFYNRLNEETVRARRQKNQLALILLDLDDFKQFNDKKGHVAGDEVLKKVGAIISANIRQGVDSGYRYGGDEFAVILIDANMDISQRIAKRIDESIEKECKLTASTGYANFSEEMTAEAFVEKADQYLYKFKGKRKNLKKDISL
jgi:two-component system cell cycle response regulator